MQDIKAIRQAFDQWSLLNWFRSFVLAVIPVMYSLSMNRYLRKLCKGLEGEGVSLDRHSNSWQQYPKFDSKLIIHSVVGTFPSTRSTLSQSSRSTVTMLLGYSEQMAERTSLTCLLFATSVLKINMFSMVNYFIYHLANIFFAKGLKEIPTLK